MVEEQLKQLGLGEKEVAVYLAVLRRGKTTPAAVARETGINRPTVYATAKTLVDKGLLSEDLAGPTKYLVAEAHQSIVAMVEREKLGVAKKLELAKNLKDELASLATNKQYSIPKIKFVEERNIEEYLYKQAPIWTADTLRAGTSWWGFQDHAFVEHFGAWVDWYWQNMDKRVDLNALSNDSKVEKEIKGKHERRRIRFWPKAKFDSTTWIAGDYIVMICTREKPRYLVEINDAVMARNFRQLFEGIWEDLESPKSTKT